MKTLGLMVLVLASLSVEAKMTHICSLIAYIPDGDTYRTVTEVREQSLRFEKSGSTYKAKFTYKFTTAPEFESEIIISEADLGSSVKWNSAIKTLRSGQVVAHGYTDSDMDTYQAAHEFKSADGAINYSVTCDAYDKPDSSDETRVLSRLDGLRLRHVGGSALLRSYADEMESVDAYGLFQLVLKTEGPEGQALRRLVHDLMASGYYHDPLGATGTLGRVKTYFGRELFYLGLQFNKNPETDRVWVGVYGEIIRVGKRITGFHITSLQIDEPKTAGGSSSSSGGRVKGQ